MSWPVLTLLFVALAATSFAAKSNTAKASTYNPAAFGIRVENGRFVEANGSPLVLRGVNYAHTWYNHSNLTSSNFAEIAALNANAVRVVLSNGGQWTRNTTTDVANVIQLCKNNELICVLEVHDATGWNESQGAVHISTAVDYWIYLRDVLVGQEDYVIINIANEPFGNMSTQNWAPDTSEAITDLRAAGLKHSLIIDAPNWGQDWTMTMKQQGAQVLAADPQQDTMLSVHMYEVYNTAEKVESYLSFYLNAGLPIMVGEFGFAHGPGQSGDVAEDAIFAYSEANDISWLAWSWCGNSGGVEYLDMENGTGCSGSGLNAWGQEVANNLASAVTASIYTGITPSLTTLFDYDGDGKADRTVRRPSNDLWYLLRTTAGYTAMTWGQAGDLLAPADYDGDGKTDIAVFRPSTGTWFIVNSGNGAFVTYSWGADGDLPVPADHNADGKADLVLFRQSNGMFYRRMSDNSFSNVSFGVVGDKPVIGDFDNDGQFDIGVYRPSNNNWYIRKSTAGFFVQTWGEGGDVPVPADYDGDGQTDLAVWRSSNGRWYRAQSTAGFDGVNWGVADDKPIPADYDGDGKADVAIFRPATGTWYMIGTTIGQLVQQFGQDGDVPTPSAFIY